MMKSGATASLMAQQHSHTKLVTLRHSNLRQPSQLMTQLSQRAARSMVFLLMLMYTLTSTSSSTWSDEELTCYDDLRKESTLASDVMDVQTLPKHSSVVEVTLLDGRATCDASPEATGGDGGGDDDDGGGTYRLCGLTSMTALSSDGVPRVPRVDQMGAAILALLHFNTRNATVVRDLDRMRQCNVRLTIEYFDTERNPIVANKRLVDEVLTREHSLETPRPCSLVGASLSSVSDTLSILSSVNNIPAISYASTSSHLDNKGIYKLFGRTVPTDSGTAIAAVSYLRDVLKVTHCAVLHVLDEWGVAFNKAFTQAAIAHGGDPPMRVVSASYIVDDNATSIKTAVGQLAESGFNYFFAIVQTAELPQVLKVATEFGIMGPSKSWLFGEMVLSEKRRNLLKVHGLTLISLGIEPNRPFEEAWATLESDENLKQYILSKTPQNLSSGNITFYDKPNEWNYFTYDTVMSIGFAACEAEERFFSGPTLFEAFTKTSFTGVSGDVRFDRDTGTRDVSRVLYKVTNVVRETEANERSGPTFRFVKVAQMRVGNRSDHSALKWITVNSTVYAGGGAVAPPILPPLEITNSIGMGIICFGLTLSTFCMSTSVMWGVWTIINRNTRVVSSAQPRFLLMLCVGTFVAASSIVPPSLQVFGVSQGFLDTSCMAGPWLMCLGWVVTFSAIFSKTLRVYKLIKRSHSFQRIKTKPKDFMLPFVFLFTFTVFVLVSWTVVAPLKWRHTALISSVDEFGRSNIFYARCAPKPGKAIWPFLLLLFVLGASCLLYSVYVTYQARHIPIEYSETHYISICVISILQAFLVGVPVWVIVRNSPQASYVLGAILVTAFCAAVLLPIFVPKERARRTRKETQELKSLIKEEKNIYVGLLTKNQLLKDEKKGILQLQRRASQTQTQEMGPPPQFYIGHIMHMCVSSLTSDTNDGNMNKIEQNLSANK